MDDRQFCTFFVDGVHFGIEVLEVQEVLKYHEMTQVPLAPDVIMGLINLRGQIVTALDLRKRLTMPPRVSERNPMNVVIRNGESHVSLLVDEIGDVLETNESTFEPPPATLDDATRELVRGVYKLDDGLLLVLDTERVLAVDTEPN
jgi:purine-binding chemotaxis protein CheW